MKILGALSESNLGIFINQTEGGLHNSPVLHQRKGSHNMDDHVDAFSLVDSSRIVVEAESQEVNFQEEQIKLNKKCIQSFGKI